MMVRDIVRVEDSITSTDFSVRYLEGNQRWVYRDEGLGLGDSHFLSDGSILQVVPLFDVRVNGVRERFKALMVYILDLQGNKIDEVVYLTVGGNPGKSIPRYVIKK